MIRKEYEYGTDEIDRKREKGEEGIGHKEEQREKKNKIQKHPTKRNTSWQ